MRKGLEPVPADNLDPNKEEYEISSINRSEEYKKYL